MKFTDFFWPDSDLERISVEYDLAELTIWNDAEARRLVVRCHGFAGMTDLCIWDDQIILDVKLRHLDWPEIVSSQDGFLRKLCDAYGQPAAWYERKLTDGLWILEFQLTNQIWFKLYCQDVEVVLHPNQEMDDIH